MPEEGRPFSLPQPTMQESGADKDLIGVPQTEILALLKEAASPTTSPDRFTQIQVRLTSGVVNPEEMNDDETAGMEGVEALLNNLIFETAQNNPQMLPGLFPAIALAGGQRHIVNDKFATIDWSLVKSPQENIPSPQPAAQPR